MPENKVKFEDKKSPDKDLARRSDQKKKNKNKKKRSHIMATPSIGVRKSVILKEVLME